MYARRQIRPAAINARAPSEFCRVKAPHAITGSEKCEMRLSQKKKRKEGEIY
jgi:hypothetical protein